MADSHDSEIVLATKSQFFVHSKWPKGVPPRFEKILFKSFMFNGNARCITISPPASLDGFVREVHWFLQNNVYFLVREEDKKGRLHWHGVINLPYHKVTDFQSTLTRNIGFTLIKHDNPGVAWYCYMFKDFTGTTLSSVMENDVFSIL